MIVVLIIPTGIGAEIGGHAGDATPVARLLASACDTLILHPNVVNASDINEMPENSLYVEGSMLDRFLEGKIRLRPVRQNRILVVTNPPLRPETVNAVSAARATLGIQAEIVVLDRPLEMVGRIEGNRATGDVQGWEELVEQVEAYEFDALAIASRITVDEQTAWKYLRTGGINPWGGVEAIVSRLISETLNKPVAHAPQESELMKDWNEIADPRMAAEMVSMCYLHCVLKGLHKAPKISGIMNEGFLVRDVSCLVTPINCVGRPHRACLSQGIPILAVRENQTCLNDPMPPEFIVLENYLEAAGWLLCLRNGTSPASVRRPITPTRVH